MNCPKARYPTRVVALLALSKIQGKKDSRREETRAYKCPDCGGWHLSSKAKRAGRKKARDERAALKRELQEIAARQRGES